MSSEPDILGIWGRVAFSVFLVLWFVYGPKMHLGYGQFFGQIHDAQKSLRVMKWAVRPLAAILFVLVWASLFS